MTTPDPLVARIVAVLQKDYGLGPDSARSIVRCVLEMSAAEHPADWNHDEHCPPEALRGPCRDDCTACYETATESMKKRIVHKKSLSDSEHPYGVTSLSASSS